MSPLGRRRAERRIGGAFGLTILSALGFAIAYATTDSPQWEGACLAVAFAALAYGFAGWAKHLLPQGPYAEAREPMASPAPVRAALNSELDRDDAPLAAATLPRRMLVAAVGTLSAVAVVPLRSLFRGPRPAQALSRTAWAAGSVVVRADNTPVRASDMTIGQILTVFPRDHVDDADTPVVLIRTRPEELRLRPSRMDWTVAGIVAYSKLCTHAGCPVGLYLDTTRELFCPCHQSVFNVLAGAEPTAGPAARALPQLPLGLDEDGVLVARGPFPEPVGPGYWRST